MGRIQRSLDITFDLLILMDHLGSSKMNHLLDVLIGFKWSIGTVTIQSIKGAENLL